MRKVDLVKSRLRESIEVKEKLTNNEALLSTVCDIADTITKSILNGGKVVLAGNGGSASDCLHIAGELVGRFQRERKSFPAVVLNADVVTMTAISNDYGYDEVFSRQAQGLVCNGDVFVGISTSGNSKNILNAMRVAKKNGGYVVGLCGKDGGIMANESDLCIVIPSSVTARIQESHITIGHIICEFVEDSLFDKVKA